VRKIQYCPRCKRPMKPASGQTFKDEFYRCDECKWTLGIDECSEIEYYGGVNDAAAERSRKHP